MKHPPYKVDATSDFFEDLKSAARWIIRANLDAEYDLDFAEGKSDELEAEVLKVIHNLATTQEIKIPNPK